jgi:hypothetical protein
VALVAFGVWALVANQSAPSPGAVVATTIPKAFYHSPFDDGGGHILFPGSGLLEFVADGPAGLVAAAHSPGAVTGSFLWKATDGRTWELVKSSSETFRNVRLTGLVGRPDGYIAAGIWSGNQEASGGRPIVWTSVDGVDWLPAQGLPDFGRIHRLVGGDDVLVALGSEDRLPLYSIHFSDVPNPRIWISADGRGWEQAAIDSGKTGWFADVAESEDGLLLGGSKDGEGRIWTSSDRGITWELVEDPGVEWPIGLRFVAVTNGPGSFAIAGSANPLSPQDTILWSNVSGSWVRVDRTTNHANWITWSPLAGLITSQDQKGGLGHGFAGSKVATSVLGQTWAIPERLAAWQHFGRAVDIDGLVLIPGMVGDQPALWQWPAQAGEVVTPVGPWVERLTFTAEPDNWQVVPWPGVGLMVRVGTDWQLLSDAASREPLFFEGASPMWVSEPVETSGAWLVLGWDDSGYSSIWRSVDGTHWSRSLVPSPEGNFDALYGLNGLTVATGWDPAGPFQQTSADGVTWDFEASDGPGLYKVLETTAGHVGLTYNGPATQIWFSSDGLTWRTMEDLPLLQDIFATPFGLMGSSDDGLLYELAPDLSSASPLDVPFGSGWVAGVTNTGMVVSAGEDPYSMWYTEDLETWIELPLTIEGGFPGVYPQFIGGDRLLVAGWDRGAVKIWEFQR